MTDEQIKKLAKALKDAMKEAIESADLGGGAGGSGLGAAAKDSLVTLKQKFEELQRIQQATDQSTEQYAKQAMALVELQGQINERTAAYQEQLIEIGKQQKKNEEADQTYAERRQKDIQLQIKRLKILEKQEGKNHAARIAQLQEQIENTDDVANAIRNIEGAFGIPAKMSDVFAGRMVEGADKIKESFSRLSDPEFMAEFADQLMNGGLRMRAMAGLATAGMQIFALYAAQVFNIAKQIDGMAASLAASTGAGRQHQALLIDTRYELLGVGLGAEEAAEAIGSLANTMSGFNRIQESTQGDLSETVGQLSALGVSASESTDIANMMTKSIGVAAEDVSGNLQRIAMMGTEIGAGPAEIMREYNEAMPYLVQFGSRAEEVFIGMKAMSEATSVSMATLMQISQRADTFEGAAEMASQLNALMGMNLSTTELLMASSEERLEMMKREFDATGRSFSQMGRFEQQALATAAGFSSIDEAMRFFEASPAEIAANEAAMANAAVSQEEFDKAVRDALPTMTKLIAAFNTLFVIPNKLVDMMANLSSSILKLADENKHWTGTVAAVTVSLAGLAGALHTVLGIFKISFVAFAKAAAVIAVIALQVYKAHQAFQQMGGGIKGVMVGLMRLLMPSLLVVDLFEFIGKKLGYIDQNATVVNDVLGLMAEAWMLVGTAIKFAFKHSGLATLLSMMGKVVSIGFSNLKAMLPVLGNALKVVGGMLLSIGNAIRGPLKSAITIFIDLVDKATTALQGMRHWLNLRMSPSLFEQFQMMPVLFSSMKSGLQGIASLFQSIASSIVTLSNAVRELMFGDFTRVIRLAAYMVGGAEAVALVENGPGGVAAAAGGRTTAIANTTNINNVNGNTGDMQATINLTVDLGKNRVFHDAVMTVLHAEARD